MISFTCPNATKNVGSKLGALEIILSGIGITPVAKPTIGEIAIPIKIPPGTRRTNKIAVTTKPTMVTHVEPTFKGPKPTSVASLATIKPPWLKPRKAINNPIPPEMANFKSAGIASIISSRNLKIVIKININEATKTPANVVCQGIPIPTETE